MRSLSPASGMLGVSTNLVAGLDDQWLSSKQGNRALFPAAQQALASTPPLVAAQRGKWGFPSISLHDGIETLLDTLLPYTVVNPDDGLPEAAVQLSALLLGTEDQAAALKQLSAMLGVDLTVPDHGYVLVELTRIDSTSSHHSQQEGVLVHPNPARVPAGFGLSKSFQHDVSGLKRVKPRGAAFDPANVSASDAQGYLDLFAAYGTHYVSHLTTGDRIFQVLAMPQARFDRVKTIYASQPGELTGPNAVLFQQYTTNANTGAYGYVSDYGQVLALSQDPELAVTLKAGAWQDHTFAETNSIFAPFQGGGSLSIDSLNDSFTASTAVQTELTSLAMFVEHSRKQIWRRVYAAAAIQLYPTATAPHFKGYCGCNFQQQLAQNELPGFLSTIATPTVNVYKTALDVSTLEFVAAKLVKQLTLCANLVTDTSPAPVALPGEDVLLVGQVFSLETETSVATLNLGKGGLGKTALSAYRFYGGLSLQEPDGTHTTVVDGLEYHTVASHQGGANFVRVGNDVRLVELSATQLQRVSQNLDFSFAFASGTLPALQRAVQPGFYDFVSDALVWLTNVIPSTTTDEGLLDLRVRALDAAHVGHNPKLGSFVPILPFEDYEQDIEAILALVDDIDRTIDRYHQDITARKTQELVINVGKDLNQNIIASGKLLAGYVKSSIDQQQALADNYAGIIKQKQREQVLQQSNINQLQSELNAQQADVNTAVANYKQALQDYKITASIKFGLTVVTDIFSLGTSIAVPASAISSVKELGLLVQRIQKFLNVINATYKLFEDAKGGINALKAAQESFDGISGTISSNLSWSELPVKVKAVLAGGPKDDDVVAKKTALEAAFSLLTLKGKALGMAQASIQQTAREIYNQQRQRNLVQDQIDRLKALNTNLNPAKIADLDVNKIDLIGLTGSLGAIRANTLGLLARAFVLKDQSLQYTYLQEPTALTSFDTIGIRRALVSQVSKTTSAKTEWSQFQASTTTPINVSFQVPTEELLNGGVCDLNINPSLAEFFIYVNTRVLGVVASVDNVAATDGGEFLLQLTYRGRPFLDRSYDRDAVVFNTLQRQRTYAYAVEGNTPKFSDQGMSWSDGVNPITPFSTWEVSLPKTSANKGIKLTGLTTTVTLTFVLKARIHDAKRLHLRSLLDAAPQPTVTRGMLAAAAPTKPPIGTLLSEMAGKSVLNNWDIVFCLTLSKINDTLKSQYEQLKKDKTYLTKINADTAVQGANVGDLASYNLQRFILDYGYPELTFLVNNDSSAQLETSIPSGSVAKGNRYVGQVDAKDRKSLEALAAINGYPATAVKQESIGGKPHLVFEYYNKPQPLGATATLQAVVKISKVKGVVGGKSSNILSVVLDMSKGSFSANNIQITMSDQQKLAFSNAVKAYFTQNPVTFIINSLDLTGITTLPDLKPNQFLFKPFQTQTKNDMLMLFIQTNNRATFNYSQTFISTDVPDPIPEGAECSLFINSRILFGSVLPQSMTTGWTLAGVNPGDGTKAWSAKFSAASVSGTVDLSSLNNTSSGGSPQGGSTWISESTYAPKGGNPVSWSLASATIKPQASAATGQMLLAFKQKRSFGFVEKTKFTTYTLFGSHTTNSSQDLSTEITLDIGAVMPTTISGSGRNQDVKIDIDNQKVSVDARTSGGGPCGSDDLQAKVNAQLKANLPGQITSKVNVSFDGVSVFALKNLLFPSGNYIELTDVYVPGDLLIVGNFTKGKS